MKRPWSITPLCRANGSRSQNTCNRFTWVISFFFFFFFLTCLQHQNEYVVWRQAALVSMKEQRMTVPCITGKLSAAILSKSVQAALPSQISIYPKLWGKPAMCLLLSDLTDLSVHSRQTSSVSCGSFQIQPWSVYVCISQADYSITS